MSTERRIDKKSDDIQLASDGWRAQLGFSSGDMGGDAQLSDPGAWIEQFCLNRLEPFVRPLRAASASPVFRTYSLGFTQEIFESLPLLLSEDGVLQRLADYTESVVEESAFSSSRPAARPVVGDKLRPTQAVNRASSATPFFSPPRRPGAIPVVSPLGAPSTSLRAELERPWPILVGGDQPVIGMTGVLGDSLNPDANHLELLTGNWAEAASEPTPRPTAGWLGAPIAPVAATAGVRPSAAILSEPEKWSFLASVVPDQTEKLPTRQTPAASSPGGSRLADTRLAGPREEAPAQSVVSPVAGGTPVAATSEGFTTLRGDRPEPPTVVTIDTGSRPAFQPAAVVSPLRPAVAAAEREASRQQIPVVRPFRGDAPVAAQASQATGDLRPGAGLSAPTRVELQAEAARAGSGAFSTQLPAGVFTGPAVSPTGAPGVAPITPLAGPAAAQPGTGTEWPALLAADGAPISARDLEPATRADSAVTGPATSPQVRSVQPAAPVAAPVPVPASLTAPASAPASLAVPASLVGEGDVTAGAERFVPVSSRIDASSDVRVPGLEGSSSLPGETALVVAPTAAAAAPVAQGPGATAPRSGETPDTTVLLAAPEREVETVFVPAPAQATPAAAQAPIQPAQTARGAEKVLQPQAATPPPAAGAPAQTAAHPTPATPGPQAAAPERVTAQVSAPVLPGTSAATAPVGPQPFAPLTAQPTASVGPVDAPLEAARIGTPVATATRDRSPTRIETAAPGTVDLSSPTRLELTQPIEQGDQALPGSLVSGGRQPARQQPENQLETLAVGEVLAPRPAPADSITDAWPLLLAAHAEAPETVQERPAGDARGETSRSDGRASGPVPVVRPEPIARSETPVVTPLSSPIARNPRGEGVAFDASLTGEGPESTHTSPVRHLPAETMVAGADELADTTSAIRTPPAAEAGRLDLPIVGVQSGTRLEPGELGPLLAQPAQPFSEETRGTPISAAPTAPAPAPVAPTPRTFVETTREDARASLEPRADVARGVGSEAARRIETPVVQPSRPAEPRVAQLQAERREPSRLVEPLRPGDARSSGEQTDLLRSRIEIAPARGAQSWLDLGRIDPRIALEADAGGWNDGSPVGPGRPGAAGWPLVIEAFSMANALRQAAGTSESSPTAWQTPVEALSQLLRPLLETGAVTPEIEAALWPALNVAAPEERAAVRATLERALTASRGAQTATGEPTPVVRPGLAPDTLTALQPGQLETFLIDAASDVGRLWDDRPFAPVTGDDAPLAAASATAGPSTAQTGAGTAFPADGGPQAVRLSASGELLSRSLETLLRNLDRFDEPTVSETISPETGWTQTGTGARAAGREDVATRTGTPVLASPGSRPSDDLTTAPITAPTTAPAFGPSASPTVLRVERQDPTPTGESSRQSLARRAGMPRVGFGPIDADFVAPSTPLAGTTADSLARLIWLQSTPEQGPGDFSTGIWEELPARDGGVPSAEPLAASGQPIVAGLERRPVVGAGQALDRRAVVVDADGRPVPVSSSPTTALEASLQTPVVRPEAYTARTDSPLEPGARPALVVPGRAPSRDVESTVFRAPPRGGEMLSGSLERLVRSLESSGSLSRFVTPESGATPAAATSSAPMELFDGALPPLTGTATSPSSSPDMDFRVVLGKPAAQTPAAATFTGERRQRDGDLSRRAAGQPALIAGMDSSPSSAPALDDTVASVREALARQWNIALPTPTVGGDGFHPLPQTLLSAEPMRRDDTGHAQGVYMQKEEAHHPEPSSRKHEEGHAEIDPRGMEQVLSELKWRMRLRDRWEAELE